MPDSKIILTDVLLNISHPSTVRVFVDDWEKVYTRKLETWADSVKFHQEIVKDLGYVPTVYQFEALKFEKGLAIRCV